MAPSADGGYLLAGETDSSGAGNIDAWVLKLDADGGVVWQRTYGGAGNDGAYTLQVTADGGCIVGGKVGREGSDYHQPWVFKLNADGDIEWQTAYSHGNDHVYSLQQTADNGYVVAVQETGSVLKLNADGTIAWQKDYGRRFLSIRSVAGGGYIVSGNKYVGANTDGLILKLNDDGTIAWQKTYGASENSWDIDSFDFVQPTTDGGYIAIGYTQSTDAGFDLWAMKLEASAEINFNPISRMVVANSNLQPMIGSATVTATTAVSLPASAVVVDTQVDASDTAADIENHAGPVGTLAAPSLQATPGVFPGYIELSWNAGGSIGSRFILFRSTDNVQFVRERILSESGSTGSWTDSGASGTTYHYKLVSYGDSGYSDFSNAAAATAP